MLALAASGVGLLHCVDPDVVELSNLNRQVVYTEEDLGRPKAEAAVARLRRLNADITVTGARDRADWVYRRHLSALAEDCDVLLLAADDPPDIRVWTNRAGLGAGTPRCEAGIQRPPGRRRSVVPGEGACFECSAGPHTTKAGVHSACDVRTRPDWDTAVARAVAAPPAGISAYLAAHAVLAEITGAPRLPPGPEILGDLAAL